MLQLACQWLILWPQQVQLSGYQSLVMQDFQHELVAPQHIMNQHVRINDTNVVSTVLLRQLNTPWLCIQPDQ